MSDSLHFLKIWRSLSNKVLQILALQRSVLIGLNKFFSKLSLVHYITLIIFSQKWWIIIGLLIISWNKLECKLEWTYSKNLILLSIIFFSVKQKSSTKSIMTKHYWGMHYSSIWKHLNGLFPKPSSYGLCQN